MSNFDQILSSCLEKLQITASDTAKKLLLEYALLLQKWNKTYNLTAAKSLEEIIIKHIADSLTITPHIAGEYILDVGSGAGFPGIPLAITLPQYKFILIDSQNKKVRFLHHVKLMLELKNVSVVHERVENFKTDYCFATIVTRAFASLAEIIEKTKHLCCESGQWLAMKGKYPDEELRELQQKNLGFSVKVQKLNIPFLDHERNLVCILNKNTQAA